MIIGLVLTVCVALGNGAEDCDSYRYVVDTFNSPKVEDSIADCMAVMEQNQQTMGDRYLSCQRVENRHLVKRDNRTVKQILADLEKDVAREEPR